MDKETKGTMKVTIEMDNIACLVQKTLEENIETIIRDEVDVKVRSIVSENVSKAVTDVVNKSLEHFIQDYITTTEIKVGGGFYSKEPETVYTVEEFVRKEIANILESQNLRIKKVGRTSGYSDDYENVSFQEYINRKFDPTELVQKELESFITGAKKDINKRIDETFTATTKTLLSDTVFNLLAKNDTFQKIQNNIKCIADRSE